MNENIEIRSFEVRVSGVDGDHIEGMLVPYGVWADIYGFRERFERGAFAEYLAAGKDVIYNYGHDRKAIMGRRSSGTLEVSDRDDGLWGRLLIPDTQLGRDMRVMIQRGDVGGHSIEFLTVSERWETIDRIEHRTILKAELPGVALTGTPAYKETSAAVRSLEQWREHQAEAEARARVERMKMRERELRLRA